jgi:putative ABC transport system permease protein
MNRILLRTSLRYMLRHPWQIGLCVLGVALGVAVVVAIDLANASARRAFSLSAEGVTGRATHQIVGGPSGLDDDLYRQLRVEQGIRLAAPVVEGYAQAPALADRTLQLLGVDPLAEGPFRPYLSGFEGELTQRSERPAELALLLAEPATALLAEETAAQAGLELGDTLALRIGASQAQVRVIGLLRPADDLSRRALEGVVITDIATAQELLGMVGRLSRIDLILPEDEGRRTEDQSQAGDGGPRTEDGAGSVAGGTAGMSDSSSLVLQLSSLLPPGARLVPAAARTNALEQMTRAFELNLTALSLLALIVGMFLIYNTITFSVVQRRTLIGTLRCVGVTRGQIAGLVLLEAAAISLVGALLGLGLGVLLGRGLVQLVTRTINDLYFVVTVRGLSIDPAVLLKGLILGVGATLLAALVPAVEAMLTPPRTVLRRSSMEERARGLVPRLALAGALLIGAGCLLLLIPGGSADSGTFSIVVAFAALFAIVIGAALLTPIATVLAMGLARPVLGAAFGLLGRMAARDIVASLSRTAVAVAALMVAISVSIGVGIMVGSFRQTVVSWLDQSLVADVYVSPPSNAANRTDTTLDPALLNALATVEGVDAVTRLRNVQVDTATGPTSLVAVDEGDARGRGGLRFIEGGGEETWAAWERGAVLISEPFAFRSGLGLGDTLTLATDRGAQEFPIAGVYYDYTSDRGVIRVRYATYRERWEDPAISSVAMYAAPGQSVDALVERLRGAATGKGEVIIGSNRALREGTLAIFDRTFAITAVLQLLATVVAFIGILSALMALQLERARELGMLRANGLTPGQLWGLVLAQTSLMGLTAGLLAAPLGLALSLVLVYVINRRSFGWTLDLTLDPALFAQALLVALTAAVLAGLYPALKMSRTSPALALREE